MSGLIFVYIVYESVIILANLFVLHLSMQSSGRTTQKNCYGCASAAVGHCITLLKALAFSSETRLTLVDEGLISELVEHNQRSSNWNTQSNVQDLLCLLTKYALLV